MSPSTRGHLAELECVLVLGVMRGKAGLRPPAGSPHTLSTSNSSAGINHIAGSLDSIQPGAGWDFIQGKAVLLHSCFFN